MVIVHMRFWYHGAGVIFYVRSKDKTEILLGKRRIEPDYGKYSLFGGGFSPRKDKTLFDTAMREAREETGFHETAEQALNTCSTNDCCLSINFLWLFKWQTYLVELPHKPDITEWPVQKSYSYEFSEVHWFDVVKLPENTHGGIKHAIKKCLKKG